MKYNSCKNCRFWKQNIENCQTEYPCDHCELVVKPLFFEPNKEVMKKGIASCFYCRALLKMRIEEEKRKNFVQDKK